MSLRHRLTLIASLAIAACDGDPAPSDVVHFIGFEAGSRRIVRVTLDAGDTLTAETFDDLLFA